MPEERMRAPCPAMVKVAPGWKFVPATRKNVLDPGARLCGSIDVMVGGGVGAGGVGVGVGGCGGGGVGTRTGKTLIWTAGTWLLFVVPSGFVTTTFRGPGNVDAGAVSVAVIESPAAEIELTW